jgi:hypothetical protein
MINDLQQLLHPNCCRVTDAVSEHLGVLLLAPLFSERPADRRKGCEMIRIPAIAAVTVSYSPLYSSYTDGCSDDFQFGGNL